MSPLPIQPTRHDVYDFISPTSGTKDAAVGKAVLLTGAGSVIGGHIAIHFARAGATSIVLVGRDAKALEESRVSIETNFPKCRVLSVPTDVTDPEAVASLFQKAGKIDILINNAGSTGIISPLVGSDTHKCERAHGFAYLFAGQMNRRRANQFLTNRIRQMIDSQHGEGSYKSIALVLAREIRNASTRHIELVLGEDTTNATPRKTGLGKRQVAAKTDLDRLEESETDTEPESMTGADISPCPPPRPRQTRVAEHHAEETRFELISDLDEDQDPESDERELIDSAVGMITSSGGRRLTLTEFIDKAALPAATALYLTLPRARYLSGRFINALWDMEELETHRERIISEDLLKMRVLGIDDHL
ncbi:hypothetical protein SLS53_005056 [Cytospora paraplurivora]|uniref:Uncharacterized protein n=1 Tax=Cytospora paraplurivora TaxID=2898453 RepID=A0AAN9YEZ6_9PEZI